MKNEQTMVDVEIDIPDDVMVNLAHYAHKYNITINQAMNNILKEYIEHHDPTYLLKPLERDLVNKISNMTENLTVETIIDFTSAYIEWLDNQTVKTKSLNDLIKVGFDVAEKKFEESCSSTDKQRFEDIKNRIPMSERYNNYELDSSGTGDEE